ncbi:hypothetical protein JYU34_010957 [Plutella xylostella]|uniref:Uncharacterized protein n=1 Tax=Plutella xylostella TaxID=51655 RepID=A0ABQ7QFQ5_PLUXY|nr:hypothetical protein JYU34_010957 [Plutella xylostella]
MSKPTTCKDAIALWEKAHGAAAAEAREVELQFQWPPVEKMDAALSTLAACEYWTLLTSRFRRLILMTLFWLDT